jgi:hypothetical protein
MIAFSTRVSYAFRCFLALLTKGEIPLDIARELIASSSAPSPAVAARPVAKATEKAPDDSADRAVQVLALFQRDGRLVDFLAEDVSPYPDSQLGAAVRTIHDSCRQVLDRYVKLEPIISAEEDQPVTIPSAIDPAAIKLIGNVASTPPTKGVLRHRGWKVIDVSLPSLPQGTGRKIVAPAEIEIA